MKILLIDDNPDDRLMVKGELARNLGAVEFVEVRDAAELLPVIEGGRFELAITDYQLRWTTGLDVLKDIKSKHPDMPVIMFTGTGSEEIAVEAMKSGLDDYILKSPKHFKRLPVAVSAVLEKGEFARRAREIEAKYRELFTRLPVCIYSSTYDGTTIDMNPAGLRIFRCSDIDEMRKISIEDLYLDKGDRDVLLENLRSRGCVTDFRARMRRLDGTGFWAEIHAVVKKDKVGQPMYVEGILDDITAFVKAEEGRNKLYCTLKTLFDHMPEGVFLLDIENRIVLANPVAGEHLQVLAGVGEGDTIGILQGKDIRDYIVSPPGFFWHGIELQEPQERFYEVGGRVIGSDGEGSGMIFLTREVTEERRLEERVNSQERLASIGQLAAGIAHDFNNILTVIIGYAEIILKSGSIDENTRQRVESIFQGGTKAANLVRQILDFSRKSVSRMNPVDLVLFMKEFLKFIERTIPEDIKVSLEYSPGEYRVNADPTKIQQVLANLVVNARDALCVGGSLSLGLKKVSFPEKRMLNLTDLEAGEYVAISVGDTGTGIPMEILPHIFEPFFTTKEVGKGTGLGLSQVYGIVRQHGGYIDVKSEAGEGTVFTIYLPSLEMQIKEEETTQRKEHTLPEGHGEPVLVVEDDDPVRELIVAVLEMMGYRVFTARNGVEGIESFEKGNAEIALVITDMIMPELSGIEMVRRLKELKRDVKIILLSGYPVINEREVLLKEGVSELVMKPIDVKHFAEVVRDVLS